MFSYISCLILTAWILTVSAYYVNVENDGPIVKGGTITFTATVYDDNEPATGNTFEYEWEDEAIPQHYKRDEIENPVNKWTVPYSASVYPGGRYIAQVIVKKCMIGIFCYEIGSSRTEFLITENLNGELVLIQNDVTPPNNYVSNNKPVVHQISLKKSDQEYISKAPTVLTYWFIDCTYYGVSKDFNFTFNYTDIDKVHTAEVLLMADFTPPTTTPAPTTTTTPTTTTSTTAKPTKTTTVAPTKYTTTKGTTVPSKSPAIHISKLMNRRSIDFVSHLSEVNNTKSIMINVNGTLVKYNGTFPMVCGGTQVSTDGKKTYGYFKKKLEVKAPISKVNVTGNNWIQPGDLLSLKVKCLGSKSMEYCVEYMKGEHNVTQNETCRLYYPLESCDFSIRRYLSYPKNTILIIIKNDVSKIVTPVTVNIYKVTKQAQLSVIVVPVAFSLVAVVLIVFGIAYYFQNRSRFIIEVADFNFGQQYTDMEYKTFRERLRDSIMNAFTRGPTPSSSEVPVWPPGRKYGSMT